ncbi:MAG: hypothetical protein WCC64_18995 [Aliidongia sp.]
MLKQSELREAQRSDLRTEIETTLRAILRLAPDTVIGPQGSGALGLNSLGAITLQYTLMTNWRVELAIGEILGAATIDELVALAEAKHAAYRQSGVLI